MNGDPESAELSPYRALFERSADAILIIEDGTFVDCNRAAVAMLDARDKDQVLSTHPSELSPRFQPDGRTSFDKANAMIATAIAQGSHRFEWVHRRMGGQEFPVEVLLTSVREGGRDVLHVVWRDITERRQLEEQLRHSQKMEAVGKLAGGIAHDFNNLLVAIMGHAELLGVALGDDPLRSEHVDPINHASGRAAGLIKQLLAFSHRQHHRVQAVDVGGIVTHLQRLLTRLIGDDVALCTEVTAEPAIARCDPARLEQVLLNLASNARDAMPTGGELVIGVRREFYPTGIPLAQPPLEANSYIVISVRDSGVGMDEETRLSAFDPFFTTKPVGKGTGLGLATVYGIIGQSGGGVQIQSALGRGTTVEAYLPATDEAPRRPKAPAAPREQQVTGLTVLVVDDEPSVAAVVKRALSVSGHHALVADNAEGALEIAASGARFDVILTDVLMPGMNGPELVTSLRERGVTAPAVFMSGYPADALARVEGMDDRCFLSKPFKVAALIECIRVAVGGDAEGSAETLRAPRRR